MNNNKLLLFTILLTAVNSFAGISFSRPHTAKDYYNEAERQLLEREAIEREAQIQALAQQIIEDKIKAEEAARQKRLDKIRSIARGLAFGIKSSFKLATGKAEGLKEIATGVFTITAASTTSYYTYKHWDKVSNPYLWGIGAISVAIASYI